ncbi:hypothetical protein ANCDUO_08382 [Ancylostoma duodenale]|uniref:Uncharacterized protein n=1 Tax=Ancylostoma duodenale TaxID=51022 RepID=A0A0C2GJJ7_9BILA|nr:hypothetical protein ANCDUO_08382 [Ancylostoma duodenale]
MVLSYHLFRKCEVAHRYSPTSDFRYNAGGLPDAKLLFRKGVAVARFCGDSNHYTNITTVQHLLGERRIEYATIRNPIYRFLSGYTDKCINKGRVYKEICFGCQDNMGCFLENLYSLMGTIQQSIDRGHTLELTHFAPQTW